MADLWSQERKYRAWLEVELAIVDALAGTGVVPRKAATEIRARATFNIKRMDEIEARIKHDVLAFVECVGESLGDLSRYFHMGVTSSDIVDTAQALLLAEASGLVLEELRDLRSTLKNLARKHADTLIVGRTHGMHAEPTSLGLKFAVWYNDVGRSIARLERASAEVAFGKISGSVGNYAHLDPEVERIALEKLGLQPEKPSTQIVQRDRHASFIAACALAGAVIEKMAVEIRSLQRSEIAEMEEPFGKGQKGSSSMPHKRNPVTLERLSGLARLLRGYAISSIENVALWHERDISHSSVERVIIPDTTILLHYMARAMREILTGLRINTDRMRANLELSKGLIYSQRLMLELMRCGWSRQQAYEKVQELASSAQARDVHLKEATLGDPEVTGALEEALIDSVFDPNYYLRHVHCILREVGIA